MKDDFEEVVVRRPKSKPETTSAEAVELKSIYSPLPRRAPLYRPPRRPGLPEVKINTVAADIGSIPHGGIVYSLNTLAEGTEISDRVGRRVQGLFCHVTLAASFPSAVGSEDWVRIGLIWDRQGNGTLPLTSELLDTNVTANAYLAPHNVYYYPDRFLWILDHHTGPMGTSSAPSLWYGGRDTHLDKTYRLGRKYGTSTYGSASNVVPTTGTLLIAIWSHTDSVTVSNNGRFMFCARFSFTDV